MNPIRVFLAEDHETVRHGLKLVIAAQADMQVVGEAGDGRAAADQVTRCNPDVILLDLSMPELNGLQTTRLLRARAEKPGIVVLTRHADRAYVQELTRAGAQGYVLKQSSSDQVLLAIRAVAAGRTFLDPSLRSGDTGYQPRARADRQPKPPVATAREVEVLRQMAKGFSNKEIAADLNISVKTVEVHKANAMRKLGLRNRIDIVRYAVLQAWLKDV